MKFLCSIFLALATFCDRKRFVEQARYQEELRKRTVRLEAQVTDLLLKYHNDETGPLFENAPDWTPDDASKLATFLKTESGQILQKRFQVIAGQVAVRGCADEMHTTYAAANANGWNEACQWFLKLSRVAGVQASTNDEQAPEDEAQLLERFSS